MIVPSWLQWARREVGVREIVGPQDNPRVEEYWRIGQVPLDVSDDETPWCAAFACAAIEASNIRSPRTPRARGFVDHASVVRCDRRLGAIVVLSSSRGAASGHVGFLTGVNADGRLILLGGNQGNRVCEAPFNAAQLVGIYWPKAAPDYKNYPLAPNSKVGGAQVSDG